MRIGAIAVLLLGTRCLPAAAAFQGENLLAQFPQDFRLGWQAPDGHMQEFIRPPETVDDWSAMITVQVFHGAKNADPNVFSGQLAARWPSGCPGGSARKLGSGIENGYPVALWSYACPLNPATRKPETMWLKAISGTDSLYVVQYAFRRQASRDMAAPVAAFLRQVAACDTRRVERRCSSPK